MKTKVMKPFLKLGYKVTAKTLRDLGACTVERKLFTKTFPRGAVVSKEAIRKASAADLHMSWFVMEALGYKICQLLESRAAKVRDILYGEDPEHSYFFGYDDANVLLAEALIGFLSQPLHQQV